MRAACGTCVGNHGEEPCRPRCPCWFDGDGWTQYTADISSGAPAPTGPLHMGPIVDLDALNMTPPELRDRGLCGASLFSGPFEAGREVARCHRPHLHRESHCFIPIELPG